MLSKLINETAAAPRFTSRYRDISTSPGTSLNDSRIQNLTKNDKCLFFCRGDLTQPVIEEYKVGPLPSITSLSKISSPSWKDNLAYNRRNVLAPPDLTALIDFVAQEMIQMNDVVYDVTGGYRYHNCSRHCLTWFSYLPGKHEVGARHSWVMLVRKVEGHYVQPIGFQMLIDMRDLDWKNWRIDAVWIRGEIFSGVEDVLERYPQVRSDLRRPSEPILFEPGDPNIYSTLNFRGDPLPADPPRRGPVSFMPDGRRYTLNGHHVGWQGWEFDFSVRSVQGLALHNVKFKGERLVYELVLSELAVAYTGYAPGPQNAAVIDSPYYFGLESFELFSGVDCPDYATFFDFAHFFQLRSNSLPELGLPV